jgi:RNA polymerase sigma-70 factor (ECF subfamily)
LRYIYLGKNRLEFTSDIPDASLVALAQHGDLDAFNQLAQRYERHIYNVSFRMLGNAQFAEDVTQESLLKAYRGIAGFRGENLKAWLLRIASNACNDFLRSRRGRQDLSLEVLTEESGDSWASSEPSPEQEALRGELGQEIQRGLLTLPRDQRMVLVLVDVEGMSYEEAAESVAISPGTLRSRLSRARAKLRDYLLENGELLPPSFRQ